MKLKVIYLIFIFLMVISAESSQKEDFANYREIAYGSLLYLEYPITEVEFYERPSATGFFERVLDMRIRLEARLLIQKYNYKTVNEEDEESKLKTDRYIASKINSSTFYKKKFIDYVSQLQNGDLLAFKSSVKSMEAKGEYMVEIKKLKSILAELEEIEKDDFLYPYIISFFSLNY